MIRAVDYIDKPFNISIELEKVVIDERARDGTLCTLPYDGYPNGCPNECWKTAPKFEDIIQEPLELVIIPFRVGEYERARAKFYPNWTKKQCRNSRHWHGAVVSRLKKYSEKVARRISNSIILKIPEANGVHVFDTCANYGVILDKDIKNAEVFFKMMMVGRRVG